MLSLTQPAPSTVDVGGVLVPINTDFRTWLSIWKVVENAKEEDWLKGAAILILAFSDEGPSPTPYEQIKDKPDDALRSALGFLERSDPGDEKRPLTNTQKRLARKRLIDWDWDAQSVISDFEREYAINLLDPAIDLHWWRFMSLFNGLSDTSKTMNTIRIRAADLDDKKLSAREKRVLREQKQMVMLPARTREEVAENRRLRGSDV